MLHCIPITVKILTKVTVLKNQWKGVLIIPYQEKRETVQMGGGREASKDTEAFRSKGNPVFGNNKLLHFLLIGHVP